MNTVNKKLEKLFDGQEISKEFKEKIIEIFEGAVKEKEDEIKAKSDAEMVIATEKLKEKEMEEIEKVKAKAEEVTETYKNDVLIPSIDKYIQESFAEWETENKQALTESLTVEMAEQLLSSVTSIVEKKGIKVEKKEFDIIEKLKKEINEVKMEQTKLIESQIELRKQNKELVKEQKSKIELAKFNLTESQVEKITKTIDKLSYQNDDQFSVAVESIVESYFPTNEKQIFVEKEIINEDIQDLYLKNLLKGI